MSIRVMSSLVCLGAVACFAQTYTISTVAGGANPYFLSGAGDGGRATSAALGLGCYDVAVDAAGNLYIASGGLIRKVAPNGQISTIAGGGTALGDGIPATQAALSPTAIVSDGSNLFIADVAFGVYRIREIDTNGIITTIAGGVACCNLGDGGPALNAYLAVPWGIALDRTGNIYVAQASANSNLIRKISGGTISTVAGGGTNLGEGVSATSASLLRPLGVAVDASGTIYIADSDGNRVRRVSNGIITTVAGNGTAWDSGDGGPAAQAGINAPWHVAVDSSGDVFVTQHNDGRVRLINAGGTIASLSTGAPIDTPAGLVVNTRSGVIYIANDNPSIPTVEALNPPPPPAVAITLASAPSGLGVSLDSGAPCTTPCVVNLTPGDTHTIAVTSPQAPSPGTHETFANWSDGGAFSHSITVPSTATTYTATFTTQYQLTISAAPPTAGVVTPVSGVYYNVGTVVPITASANAGFTFANWSGTVAGATSASTTVTMSAPQTVTANFSTVQNSTGFQFVPVAPCRVMDTRNPVGTFGGPAMGGGTTRIIPIAQSVCNISTSARAYSLNITVVPRGGLGYLTIWPAGQTQPVVSTLNSFDGRILANAAIVPAGSNGAISLFVSDTTDVIIDINGYFAPASTSGSLSFYAVTPCRAADTRGAAGSLGGPLVSGGTARTFPIASSSCGLPANAQAYSLNITVVPRRPLSYLTAWPAGQTQPLVSTLNSPDGGVVANAAIVPAGTGGGVSFFVTDDSDVIVDVNGYFAPPGSVGALALYTLTPCRIVDTRFSNGTFGSPSLAGGASRSFPIQTSACAVPPAAQAYSFNVTVLPSAGTLGFLTAWPASQAQPNVSTLNSPAGKVLANAAIVPAGLGGGVSVFVTNPTDLIVDINAYFAQ